MYYHVKLPVILDPEESQLEVLSIPYLLLKVRKWGGSLDETAETKYMFHIKCMWHDEDPSLLKGLKHIA
jgi:hypothetical protein